MKDLMEVSQLTMSSLEIAKLTGKQHKNVLRDIDNILKELEIQPAQISARYKDAKGEERPCYNLNKELTMTLVTGYSIKLRNAVIKRWQELENKSQLPTNYIAALERLVETEKEKLRLEQENTKLNTLIDNEFGYCSILRAAQFLGVHEKTFNWRPLKKTTLGLNLEVIRAPSTRYGYQNLYPIKAFEIVYPDFDFDDLTPEKVEDKGKLAFLHNK